MHILYNSMHFISANTCIIWSSELSILSIFPVWNWNIYYWFIFYHIEGEQTNCLCWWKWERMRSHDNIYPLHWLLGKELAGECKQKNHRKTWNEGYWLHYHCARHLGWHCKNVHDWGCKKCKFVYHSMFLYMYEGDQKVCGLVLFEIYFSGFC